MSVIPSPPKVYYATEAEYRAHFEATLCRMPVITYDGIPVRFRKRQFDHCMYESAKRNEVKDQFSRQRAERIDWIAATLTNQNADLYQGWDKKRRCADPYGRVAVVYGDFVVIILIAKDAKGNLTADFLTAYLADISISKIRTMPRWDKRKCR